MNSKNRTRSFASMTIVAILAILGVAVSPAARTAPAFTLEQIRNFAFPDTLVASPSGSRVAWLMNERGVRNIWVAEAPQFTPRKLTAYADDDGQEITSISISADGNSVVYVRGGDHGANWDGGLPANPTSNPAGAKVQVWYAPYAGGTSALLSEGDWPVISPDNRRVVFIEEKAAWVASLSAQQPDAKRLFTIRGDTGSPAWSPDGSKLAFVSDRDSHSLIGIYSDERTPIRWVAASFTADSAPRWSPNGKYLAFVRQPGKGGVPDPMLKFAPSPWAIWLAELATGDAKELWRSGSTHRDGYFEGLFDWAAGDRVVFQSYQDGWPHLYSIPLGGKPALLTPGDFMVEDATLSADKKAIVYSANYGKTSGDGDRRHVFQVDVASGKPQQLTSGTGLEWSPVLASDGQIVFLSSTAQRPPLLTVQSKRGGEMRLAGAAGVPASHPSSQLVTPTPVTFKADDGFTVHGQLFEPKGGGKHAAVVYIHGGPRRQMLLGWHPMEYYSNDYALNQYLVSRGYVVLAVNYRLGVGYGYDFQFPAASGIRGGSEYKDIVAAGRMLQSLANVDPKRIGIYGGSYGGYLTAMGLAHDSSLFKVGVDIHGVHNWAARYNFGAVTGHALADTPVDAAQALETAWTSSPVSAVAGWKSPVLFIHGDDDRNVAVSQTVDLVRRLQQLDVPFEMLNLPDETHGILRYSNVLQMNAAAAEFLERHLSERRP